MPSIELKPCPFCGGEAEVLEDRVRVWGLIQHSPECWLAYDMPRFRQEIPKAEFKSWNTRAEQTCRMVLTELRGPAYTDIYECSECGEEVMVGTVMGESERPKWCPNCGAKVVVE